MGGLKKHPLDNREVSIIYPDDTEVMDELVQGLSVHEGFAREREGASATDDGVGYAGLNQSSQGRGRPGDPT